MLEWLSSQRLSDGLVVAGVDGMFDQVRPADVVVIDR